MKITEIQVGEDFHICPNCGYTDGFHTALMRKGQGQEVILICPQCHGRFRPGWTIAPVKKS